MLFCFKEWEVPRLESPAEVHEGKGSGSKPVQKSTSTKLKADSVDTSEIVNACSP